MKTAMYVDDLYCGAGVKIATLGFKPAYSSHKEHIAM